MLYRHKQFELPELGKLQIRLTSSSILCCQPKNTPTLLVDFRFSCLKKHLLFNVNKIKIVYTFKTYRFIAFRSVSQIILTSNIVVLLGTTLSVSRLKPPKEAVITTFSFPLYNPLAKNDNINRLYFTNVLCHYKYLRRCEPKRRQNDRSSSLLSKDVVISVRISYINILPSNESLNYVYLYEKCKKIYS